MGNEKCLDAFAILLHLLPHVLSVAIIWLASLQILPSRLDKRKIGHSSRGGGNQRYH